MFASVAALSLLTGIYDCYDIKGEPDVLIGATYAYRGTRIPYSIAHTIPNITVSFADADPATYYSLAMIDPDAPSPTKPTYREIRHWLVGNIIGQDFANGDTTKGKTLSAFRNPSPPKGSGFHRYVQLVFKQQALIPTFAPIAPSIAKWNVTAWAASESLELLGCNFFETEYGTE